MGRTPSQRSLAAQHLPSTEAVQPCSQCQHGCRSCSAVLMQKCQLIEAEALSVSRGRGDEHGFSVACIHSSQGATAANMTCSGTTETPAASSNSDTLQGSLVSSSRMARFSDAVGRRLDCCGSNSTGKLVATPVLTIQASGPKRSCSGAGSGPVCTGPS